MAFSKDSALQYLRAASEAGRLAHAYLIAGPPGSGKRDLAVDLCRLVNPDMPNGADVLTSPNVSVVEPESKSRRILIEQIRELEHALHLKTLSGGRKVGIIFEADRLQPGGANAFLKTLEEPPANSFLLIVTATPEALLDTIRSRCISVPLRAPAGRDLSENQRAVLDLLQRYYQEEWKGIGPALTFCRQFQEQLAGIRGRVTEEIEREADEEQAHYRDTTDGRWLKVREDHFKALAESRYISGRTALIDTLVEWWGDVLRHQQSGRELGFLEYVDDTASLAERFSTSEVLRKIDALEALRDQLSYNIQEALALEVAFLRAFGEGVG